MNFTVKNSFKVCDDGIHFAKFVSVEECETKIGVALRWKFELDTGGYVSELTTTEPTDRNKLGRFLAMIAGSKNIAGLSVNPDNYTGDRYILSVSDGKIVSFSKA